MSISEQKPTCIHCCRPIVLGSGNVRTIPGEQIDATTSGADAHQYLVGLPAYAHIDCPDDDDW